MNAARRFSGSTLNVAWESGFQALDPLRFGGPEWERLTGVRINVVQLGFLADQYRRITAEHQARTGALDCGGIVPSWLPDFVAGGVLEPLDPYVEHYMIAPDLADYLPIYQSLGIFDGRRYGLFDDGDVLLLYYRRDLFEDEANQREFAARHGRPLGDPRTYDWRQFLDVARFFTERHSPRLYGFGPFTRDLHWGWFEALLRMNGGQFFDRATMQPGVNAEPGRRAMAGLSELMSLAPPVSGDVDQRVVISTYLTGSAAMASFWPPLGRWAEGYGLSEKPLAGMPPTQVARKTGYALLPGGYTEMAAGFLLSVFATSRQKEVAYLFIQWLTSPEISLRRVMLPYALRDPYRKSHVESLSYRALWPAAPEYLDTLGSAATDRALLDLIIPAAQEYANVYQQAVVDVRLGTEVSKAMDRLAIAWDAITERVGRARQRAAYESYLRRPGAMPSGPAAGG